MLATSLVVKIAVAMHEAGEAEAAASLWREAYDRYAALELSAGVAEPRDSPCCLPSVEPRTTRWNGSIERRLPQQLLATARPSTTSEGSAVEAAPNG